MATSSRVRTAPILMAPTFSLTRIVSRPSGRISASRRLLRPAIPGSSRPASASSSRASSTPTPTRTRAFRKASGMRCRWRCGSFTNIRRLRSSRCRSGPTICARCCSRSNRSAPASRWCRTISSIGCRKSPPSTAQPRHTSMSDRQFLEPLPWLDELMDAATRAELATLPVAGWREHLAMFERNAGKWHGAANGRIRAILGPIGPQWCSDELLQAATEVSLTRGVPLHMHALESKLQAVQAQLLYGRPIVEHLDALGVLTRNLTLNHAIWLTDGEIERLGARGCSISHNPLSNLKLGSGVARVRDLKRAGVNVALGTDGTSTSDRADVLRSLGAAALIHRVGDMDYETWVTAEEAFEMATIGSAGSTGLADDIGTIEVGKKADLVLLDREDYGFIPLHRPVQQLAYAVNSDAVRTVLVDGKVVMDERVLTLVDEAALKAEMIEAANAYVRDNAANMERLAARFYPYYRAAHMRAAATDVPASRAPVRLPCGCCTALRHTLTYE